MVMTYSRMLPLGAAAPDFSLPEPAGKRFGLKDFPRSKALVVVFICNHCPYVKHMLDGVVSFAHDYLPKGVAIVAINSNDVDSYPEDSPANMGKLAAQKNFGFPYLYDESQSVAKAYQAACTPDIFLFDRERKLVYRGQFDASRPGNKLPVTGADLRAATDAVLASAKPASEQIPSVGCNIKWKAGQEP